MNNTFYCCNCRQVINIGAVQCPYCHHNPYYSAALNKGTKEDSVASFDGLHAFLSMLIFSAIVYVITPWVSFTVASIAVYSYFSEYNAKKPALIIIVVAFFYVAITKGISFSW